MQLNITTDYSIRIILYLAIKKEVTSSILIARDMGIPGKYLINLGAKLKYAGLVNTHKGKHGGYSLAKPPEDISIYDILLASEETIKINRCLEQDRYCSRDGAKSCQVRRFYCVAQEKMETYFKSITIADMMEDLDEEYLVAMIEGTDKTFVRTGSLSAFPDNCSCNSRRKGGKDSA